MKLTFIISFLAVVIFIGCSEKINENDYASIEKDFAYENQDSKLLQRVLDYWYLRSTHEFKKSYKYELPYQIYLKKFDNYADESASTYRKFHTSILKIEYQHNNSIAIVYRKYKYKNTVLNQKSKWIKLENEWYHKYDYTVFPEGR